MSRPILVRVARRPDGDAGPQQTVGPACERIGHYGEMSDTRLPRPDIRESNKGVIARYRETAGTAEGQEVLVVLTTTGEKTGRRTRPRSVFNKTAVALSWPAPWVGCRSTRSGIATWSPIPSLTVEFRGETFRARAATVSMVRSVMRSSRE